MDEPLWDFEDEDLPPPQLDGYRDMIVEAQSYCILHNRAFCFYVFNPYEEQYKYDNAFSEICRRALSILKRYQVCSSFEELNKAANNLHFVLNQTYYCIEQDGTYPPWLANEVEIDPVYFFKLFFPSCIFDSEIVFSTDKSAEEIKPCFFALNALMLIGYIRNSEIGLQEDFSHHEFAVNKSIKATELLCMAEVLANVFLEQPNTTMIERQIKSANGKKAANARHGINQAKKERVLMLWNQEIQKPNPRSKNKFAEDMAKEICLSDVTVRKWLQGLKDPNRTDELDLPF